MRGFKQCIDDAIAAGEMDPVMGDRAKELFDEVEREAMQALGPEAARRQAARTVAERIGRENAIKRRQTAIAVRKQAEIIDGLNRAQARLGLKDKSSLVQGLVDSLGINGLPFRGAEQHRKAILGRAHSRFDQALARHRRTLLGNTRDKTTLLDVLREAFGEDTGNASAKAVSQAWYETSEFLRKQFNAAGGHIAKLERWGMPQFHDVVRIRAAGFEKWRDFIKPRLDLERMVDGATGQPFTPQRLDQALKEVWETVRTEGFSKVTPSGAGVGTALANRRADPRFLHFRTADDWLSYQDEFGSADLFSSMLAHMDAMSRDIGAMRALGPNPDATIRWLQDTLNKEGKELPGAGKDAQRIRDRLERSAKELKILYDTFTGAANAPVNTRVSRTFQAVRSLLTSSQLGSAVLSAVTDTAFSRMAAAHAGIPQVKNLVRHLKLLNPRSIEDQKLAVRLGLIAENWSQVASAQLRYVGEVAGPESMRRISDAVLRATGLSPWTQAGRWAFGMEFLGNLADRAAKSFDELPAPMQKTFANYNISAADWDIIRKTEIFEPESGGFIRPEDIAQRTDLDADQADDLATKLLGMVQAETDFAIPSASLRGRAFFGGASPPGTVGGEILRSGLMYKNFAITLFFTHVMRMANQQGVFNKFKYGAALIGSTTLMGALALQLKEISKGRDPRQMTGDKATAFWIGAMSQGGGLGIFGDFAFADVNRFGSGFGQTIAGPVISFGNDTFKLTAGNMRELLEGKDTNAGAELTRYVGRYTPGASAWYARLMMERLVLDNLQRQIDPDYRKRWRRREQTLNREYGTRFFHRPGRLTPDRFPDFENAFPDN